MFTEGVTADGAETDSDGSHEGEEAVTRGPRLLLNESGAEVDEARCKACVGVEARSRVDPDGSGAPPMGSQRRRCSARTYA